MVFLGLACSGPTPEERIRATLDEAAAAVEHGDAAGLGRLVSERYADDRGHDRDALLGAVAGYLRGAGAPHVFRAERAIAVTSPSTAEVTLVVALASVPIERLADLGRISADVGRVELSLEREGEAWKLLRAEWHPLDAADLLPR